MKKIILTLLILTTITLSNMSKAQKIEQTKNSLLWEITGNGLQKPSYLFGTIHMICENDFFISEKLTKAINHADQLVLEINLADTTELKDLQQSMISSVPLSKQLTSIQYHYIDSVISHRMSLSLKQLENASLLFLNSILLSSTLPCKTPKVYEIELIDLARKRNLPIRALETVKDQVNSYNKAFPKDFLLSQMMLSNEYGEYFAKMIEDYKNEDISSLYSKMSDKRFLTDESYKWMLTERNANWVKIMPEMMQKNSVLFAVGTAHLGGKDGVIELLKKKGYTVKPVLN
ncbi:TraB/GumN family protein [Solitalea lacus]|uniref:TraB/GumN family protein n=1 Tax=Solitalea lacus TaxID=2911172 RepID=UPI001EDB968C|nr:TraB/GumN family protein [Solitalea lacus]UKJ07360.1 TraB/GumN family protein [Solitalea lacus]